MYFVKNVYSLFVKSNRILLQSMLVVDYIRNAFDALSIHLCSDVKTENRPQIASLVKTSIFCSIQNKMTVRIAKIYLGMFEMFPITKHSLPSTLQKYHRLIDIFHDSWPWCTDCSAWTNYTIRFMPGAFSIIFQRRNAYHAFSLHIFRHRSFDAYNRAQFENFQEISAIQWLGKLHSVR